MENFQIYAKLEKQYTVRNIWGWNPNFQVAAVNPVPLVGGRSSGDRAQVSAHSSCHSPPWCWDQGLLCQVLLPARLAGPWESGVCSFLTFGFFDNWFLMHKRGSCFPSGIFNFFFLSGLFGRCGLSLPHPDPSLVTPSEPLTHNVCLTHCVCD